MDTLDDPVKLQYNNGSIFPSNFLIMGYTVLGGSILLIATGTAIILGVVLLFLSACVVTNRHIVDINTEGNFIHDYSLYLGFVKIGKKHPLDKFRYITTMPLIESHLVYAGSSQSTVDTNVWTTVTFFGERLRGKRIVAKYNSRNEAHETASQLADRLGLKFFQYDPKLVREVLLGQRTI